jgi:hypothetical protein
MPFNEEMGEIRREHLLEQLEAKAEQTADGVERNARELAQLRAELAEAQRVNRRIAGENLALKLEINNLHNSLGYPPAYPDLPSNPTNAFGLLATDPPDAEPDSAAPAEAAANAS